MKKKQINIHRQICEVYRENAMSGLMVRRWVRQFNEELNQVHDENRSGHPSVVSDELVRAVKEKIKEHSSLSLIILHLNLHKFHN